MEKKKITTFLNFFPDHVYRFIDQTGNARQPVSSQTYREDLNIAGYEAYFTVNGFKNTPDAKRERCTSLNGFFIDIDGRKDEAELEYIKALLEPTFIIETMRGYHVHWLLDEPVYKEDLTEEEWNKSMAEWERIEESIVKKLNADPVVKDLTRILRVPGSYYWKKTNDLYKEGPTKALFTIIILHENHGARYSMQAVKEVFPQIENTQNKVDNPGNAKTTEYAENERADFFAKVEKLYPTDTRPSFLALISGKPGTLPSNVNSRNEALLITAALMRRAGWSQQEALMHVKTTGWHGIESERGGEHEITSTIASAYRGGYTYSAKHPIIAHNMKADEERKLAETYTQVLKIRKETDKTRYSIYEHELIQKFPYLKKNEVGMFFMYKDGVYRMMNDEEMSSLILASMYEDMLWGFRTNKGVSDKIACLLSIVPKLELTNDKGRIINVKNGLLDIVTRELKPHTPEFVSLAQSPVTFEPNAEAPTWVKCVETWMEGDEAEEKAKVLQQYSGYCLSSSMKYSKMLFLVGDGGNGKSTFADTISMIIGNDATSRIDLEDIYSSFGLAGLIGKRLNIVEEVSGNYYQSHKLKKLVSGEEVTINMKYKDQFKFVPQAKFIFAVNAMPQVDDASMASERRILAVHFKNNFRTRPDTSLRFADGVLAKELSGILNWMLDGIRLLREGGGFITTKEQTKMLKEYREENSSVEGFVSECLIPKEGHEEDTRNLYTTYTQFCMKEGRRHKKKMTMIKEMQAYGERTGIFSLTPRLNSRTAAKFEGVMINPDWEFKSAFSIDPL